MLHWIRENTAVHADDANITVKVSTDNLFSLVQGMKNSLVLDQEEVVEE